MSIERMSACAFCCSEDDLTVKAPFRESERDCLVPCDRWIYKDKWCIVTPDPAQVSRGHALAILRNHRSDFADPALARNEHHALIDAAAKVAAVMKERLSCDPGLFLRTPGETSRHQAHSRPLDLRRVAVFGIVRRGRASIHFNRGNRALVPSRLPEGAYDLYFDVTNLYALADELRSRRAEILDGPEERAYGQREVVVRDCNGFVLTFGEPIQTGIS